MSETHEYSIFANQSSRKSKLPCYDDVTSDEIFNCNTFKENITALNPYPCDGITNSGKIGVPVKFLYYGHDDEPVDAPDADPWYLVPTDDTLKSTNVKNISCSLDTITTFANKDTYKNDYERSISTGLGWNSHTRVMENVCKCTFDLDDTSNI